MRRLSSFLAALVVVLGIGAFIGEPLFAAGVPQFANPSGPSGYVPSGTVPANVPGLIPDLNTLVNNINASGSTGINSNTMAAFSGSRNYLDNGAMTVAQRGTSAQTGGTTSGCTVNAYVADRWCVDTNVASGAGKGQVVTSSPSPITGFTNSMTVWRNSGALTQQVCAIQEIPTKDATQLAGQTVTLSAYLQALAGLNADNGNVVTMNLFTGTGSDEGLGTMTASPAITPAWTGIATQAVVNGTTKSKTITTGWVRYNVSYTIPSAATEIAVAICFTPTATGSGATDGFAMAGVQLEQGLTPSSFEFRPYGVELAKAQQYYVQITDPAATVEVPSSCFVVTANTTVKCGVYLPQTMRATPTTTIPVAASFGIVVTAGTAGTCTTLAATASSNSLNSVGVTCTTGGTIALGSATPLIGQAAAGGMIQVSADF